MPVSLTAGAPKTGTSRAVAVRSPREHGAWVMLLVPLAVGTFAFGRHIDYRTVLLLVSATAGLYGGSSLETLVSKRGVQGSYGLTICLLVASLASACAAAYRHGLLALLNLMFAVAVLAGAHLILRKLRARKPLDRTVYGELLGVAILTSSGPAAMLVYSGKFGHAEVVLWAACFGFFASGVIYVKMVLEAAKHRDSWSSSTKRHVGMLNNSYLPVLSVTLAIVLSRAVGNIALLTILAYMPALVRSIIGYHCLTPILPRLRTIGLREAILSIWFGVMLSLALYPGDQ